MGFTYSKGTPIESLETEDKVALVLVLLKQLQPYLSSQNLSLASPVQKPGKEYMSGSKNAFSPQKNHMMPDIGKTGGTDVDALNSILNNINVQTRHNFNN